MNLFKKRQPAATFQIVCPYCMTLMKSDKPLEMCQKCNTKLPTLYRERAYGDPPATPFFMQLSGNIQTRFTVVSSLGAEAGTVDRVDTLSPRRVLDPFFWALYFEGGFALNNDGGGTVRRG